MITKFPSFLKLNLRQKNELQKYIKDHAPYSDFNFTSLWTYNTQDKIELSELNKNLVVKFTDYLTQAPFFSFIGKNKVPETSKILINYAIKKKINSKLKLVPQSVVESLKKISNDFTIKEDYDNHDYIVSAKNIAILPEDVFKRKKYQVKRFERKYPNHQVKFLNLKEKKTHRKIYELFDLWAKISEKSKSDTKNELAAINRLLSHIEHFDVFTLSIFDKNKLIAFNIYEKTHRDYGISAFQKANKSYTGIYSKLTHEAAKHIYYSLNCNYINFEQDLGIEGLRLSKSLWKPSHYLKKYLISLKK